MKYIILLVFICLFISPSCEVKRKNDKASVQDVMDNVVTRLYSSLTDDQLDTISNEFIQNFLTEKEKYILATKYWYFNWSYCSIIIS